MFRGGLELVQLDVTVLDRKRQPVTGLSASDFTVFENGVQRPVRAFTAIQLPARGSSGQAALPAARFETSTNQVGQQDGRIVVILMDRSIPAGQPTMAARKVAAAAVEQLGPYDLAALISTSGSVPQNLTADRTRLLRKINEPRNWSANPSKEIQDLLTIPDDRLSDPRCLCGLCVLETLTRISDALQNTPRRRKVLFFIGSSVVFQSGPRPPSADVGCDYRLSDARRTLWDSLAISNLTVYSIDPGGLTTVGPQTRAGAPGGRPGIDAPVQRLGQMQTETSALLADQGSLQVLPDLTGGRTVVNRNLPEETVPEIFRESDTYYIVAFESGAPGAQDEKRTIDVKVARSDVHVHAQRQYWMGPAEKAPTVGSTGPKPMTLERALGGLLPNASRPLTLAAAAFASADMAKATVVVNVEVGAFAHDRATAMPLAFAVSAVDPTGRQVAFGRETATVTFTPGTPARPAEGNVQTLVDLKPGDYEIRVAVSDPATQSVASVFAPVSVQQFGSAPLSLSDLVVETTGLPELRSASSLVAPTATTRRRFERDETVRAVVQVYQGVQRTILPVSVRTAILNSAGGLVRDQRVPLTAKDFASRRASLAADLSQLPAGEYVLNVEASLDKHTASRTLHFVVQ